MTYNGKSPQKKKKAKKKVRNIFGETPVFLPKNAVFRRHNVQAASVVMVTPYKSQWIAWAYVKRNKGGSREKAHNHSAFSAISKRHPKVVHRPQQHRHETEKVGYVYNVKKYYVNHLR
jgi:hypothetical protein